MPKGSFSDIISKVNLKTWPFFLRQYESSQGSHFEESKSVMKRFAMCFLWKLQGVGVLFGTID